jgi:hypothetical protein
LLRHRLLDYYGATRTRWWQWLRLKRSGSARERSRSAEAAEIDTMFACAVIGEVDFLISDNENVLGWKKFGKTRVVNPQQFALLLEEKIVPV